MPGKDVFEAFAVTPHEGMEAAAMEMGGMATTCFTLAIPIPGTRVC